jgi:hypothetical protein
VTIHKLCSNWHEALRQLTLLLVCASHHVLLSLQELGIVLDSPARLTQVQILSHQSKIATKIELFVGRGNDYEVL